MTDTVDLPISEAEPHQTEPPPRMGSGEVEALLGPALEDLERERKVQQGEFLFRIAVTVLGTAALAVASGLAVVGALGAVLRDLGGLVTIVPPLACAGLGYWASLARRRYITGFKKVAMPAIASALGDFHYDSGGKIGDQRLTGSTLLPPHEVYHSEDLFFGHHKGIEVALAEVKLTREQGSGKDRKTVTAFKGLFALLSLQRAVSGKTVVRLNAGAAANWLGGTFGGMERYTPQVLAFDNRFEAYTTEPAEAGALLASAVLERLSALDAQLGGVGLQAAFYEDQFFIMVSCAKDLFEPPSIFKSIQDDKGIVRIAGEFRHVLAMIDGMVPHDRAEA